MERKSILSKTIRTGLLPLLGAALLLAVVVPPVSPEAAPTRSCRPDERQGADQRLLVLMEDTAQQQALRQHHLPFGIPATVAGGDNERILYQDGFLLAYDADLRTGLWVAYRLRAADLAAANGRGRVNCFRRDPRESDGPRPSDYDEPLFDQGHLANDADLKDNPLDQLNSYVMTNMSPQHCRFNRGLWLSLEHLVRRLTVAHDEIFVITGAIFDRDGQPGRDADAAAHRMVSRNGKARVAVASHFYKVILRHEAGQWRALSFLLPHDNEAHGVTWEQTGPLLATLVRPIEWIEAMTGLRLAPNIPRSELLQNRVADWSFDHGGRNLEGGCS